MRKRYQFGWRTLLIAIGCLVLIVGLAVNWHVRSGRQYVALNTVDYSDGIWIGEFNPKLQIDPETGLWIVAPNAGIKLRVQAWLCRFFDPYYVLDIETIFLPNANSSDMEFVENLKGVRRIVLRSNPEPDIIEAWKSRFRGIDVISELEWQRLKYQP